MTTGNPKGQSGLPPENIAPHAIVVGDPARAMDASCLLEAPQEVWSDREFRAFTGSYRGKRITVCSHGVGASGALFILENLFNAGVHTIIRAGTCGGLVEGVNAGDLIIATGAVRDEGLCHDIVPIEYPAIADRHVVAALEAAARDLGTHDPRVGLIWTRGLFFHYPHERPLGTILKNAGVIGIEMEFSALLILAAFHHARAGGLFAVDGNLVNTPDPWDYDPEQEAVSQAKSTMLKVALNALASL